MPFYVYFPNLLRENRASEAASRRPSTGGNLTALVIKMATEKKWGSNAPGMRDPPKKISNMVFPTKHGN